MFAIYKYTYLLYNIYGIYFFTIFVPEVFTVIWSTDPIGSKDKSGLPRGNPCFTNLPKEVSSYFPNETKVGTSILKFVTFRTKLYVYKIYRLVDNVRIKAKEVGGHVIKYRMFFEEHKKCLLATEADEDVCEFDPYIFIRKYL